VQAVTLSPAEALVVHLASTLGQAAAHEALDVALAGLTTIELAGLEHHWPFWCRPAQHIAPGDWATHGFMGGRGAGKTTPCAHYVVAFAEAHPGCRIALVGPTEDDVRRVMIEGKSGLLAASPPWFPATYEPGVVGGRVTWPNKSQAFQYGAESPDRFRGPEHHLAWCTECGAWGARTADAAWSNLGMGLRLPPAQLLWDSSPKTVPLVARLIAAHKADPAAHRIVPSRMKHNWANLPVRYVIERYAEWGGTRWGRQELDGEYLEDVDGALFSVAWFKRDHAPGKWRRRVLSVDPAASPESSKRDETGIISGGLADDGRIFICRDQSARHGSDTSGGWPAVAVAAYLADEADVMLLEVNMGHDMVFGLVHAAAKERGLAMKMLGPAEEPPPHNPRTIYAREVRAKGTKDDRAMPVSAFYEKGRVLHALGADLVALEDQLTSFVPRQKKSPDRVDATVHLVWELAGLGREARPDGRRELVAATAALSKMTAATPRGEAPSALARLRGPWRGPAL
jgi:phage terminase large subunit-like protein